MRPINIAMTYKCKYIIKLLMYLKIFNTTFASKKKVLNINSQLKICMSQQLLNICAQKFQNHISISNFKFNSWCSFDPETSDPEHRTSLWLVSLKLFLRDSISGCGYKHLIQVRSTKSTRTDILCSRDVDCP